MAKLLLNKKNPYIDLYDPNILFPIARNEKRVAIGISEPIIFQGVDIWRAYEMSWLNLKGKPQVAIGEFVFSCSSKFLVESKSLKLYLNSLNQTKFATIKVVEQLISKDLSKVTDSYVHVKLKFLSAIRQVISKPFQGYCLDNLDIECNYYKVCPTFLSVENRIVNEIIFSNLLKSNCLVTQQPDWGSIQIKYYGKKINKAGLLRYLVSYRQHNDFHEQCVERIFMDLMRYCAPMRLFVYAKYTRRGGIDINPIRFVSQNRPWCIKKRRDIRQ